MFIQGYEVSVEAVKRALEAVQGAMPSHIAQAVSYAGRATFLRNRYDVDALVGRVGTAIQ